MNKGMFLLGSTTSSPIAGDTGYPAVMLGLGDAEDIKSAIWDLPWYADAACVKVMVTDVPWGSEKMTGYTTKVKWPNVMAALQDIAWNSVDTADKASSDDNIRRQCGVPEEDTDEEASNNESKKKKEAVGKGASMNGFSFGKRLCVCDHVLMDKDVICILVLGGVTILAIGDLPSLDAMEAAGGRLARFANTPGMIVWTNPFNNHQKMVTPKVSGMRRVFVYVTLFYGSIHNIEPPIRG